MQPQPQPEFPNVALKLKSESKANSAQGGKLYLLESVALKPGKRSVKRLKARHLSALTKQIIIDKFAATESYDDVADAMQMPGLTGKTVSEVLHSMQLRKGPATERFMTVRSWRTA